MKRNLMPLLGVAFVAAVVATGIFYGLLIPRLRSTASADESRYVVAATHALDRGTVLKPEDLHLIPLEGKGAPAKPVRGIEEAVGLTLLEPASANQPLAEPMLASRGSQGGAALAIPPGRRAVCIHPADSAGIVAMMRSGSRVDIQVLDTRASQQLRRLLENVEVLSVLGAENNAPRPVVTLLVDPDDADRLSLADATLQLRLVLRNPADPAVSGERTLASTALVPAAK